MKKALIILTILMLSLFPSTTALADTISLGIYPPIAQISALPPASVVSGISIENPQDQTIKLTIKFKEFIPSPKQNGDLEYVDKPLPAIFQKMQIYDGEHVVNQITLAPKQKKSLQLHVGIPKDEKPQDYYFSVLFVSNSNDLVDSTQSQAVVGIATNVLLSIGPIGATEGRIAEFSSPFFVAKGPVPFKIRVENTSSHYISPTGLVTIKNMFGQTVGKIDLLSVNVLANSTRIIPAPKEASIDDPKASWNEKFLLGFYTAKVTIGMSPEGPIYNKSTTFLAFPIELLAGFIISLGIVIVIVKRVREKQIKKG